MEFLRDDNNSIHTTQMISLKKCLNQRNLFEDMTRACVRSLNWNSFRHWSKEHGAANETLYDHFWTRKTSVRTKKNRRHRKVGCQISSISHVLMEITDAGVVRSSVTNVLDKSLTHKHLFVSIWVSCKKYYMLLRYTRRSLHLIIFTTVRIAYSIKDTYSFRSFRLDTTTVFTNTWAIFFNSMFSAWSQDMFIVTRHPIYRLPQLDRLSIKNFWNVILKWSSYGWIFWRERNENIQSICYSSYIFPTKHYS